MANINVNGKVVVAFRHDLAGVPLQFHGLRRLTMAT